MCDEAVEVDQYHDVRRHVRVRFMHGAVPHRRDPKLCYIAHHIRATLAVMEAIGIRELRQHASRIIEAAEGGTTYRVTNHGKDTGVFIGKQQHAHHDAAEQRTGASPDQVIASGVYDSPKPATYEEEMLRLVEQGRDRSGRIDNA